MTTILSKEQKYDIALGKNRLRQQRWYTSNKAKVNEQRRAERALYKAQQQPQPQQQQPQPQQPIPDIEPVYEQENHDLDYDVIETPQEIAKEIPKFLTLTPTQLKKIKPVATKSKQTLAGILKHLETNTAKGSIPTYKTTIQQLYEISNTEKHAPINLNNPHILFQQLDNFKYKGKSYGIDKLTNFIQTIIKIADPKNGFKLEVTKQAQDIYKKKFDLFKIYKKDNQNKNKEERKVFLFTDILEKSLTQQGKDSKFYLYLRLYQLAPIRDNFQLKIITDSKDATDKSTNYIILPPIIKKGNGKGKKLVFKISGSLVIKTYKTKNKYGELKFPLTAEVTELTRQYMQNNKINVGDYLFGNYAMSMYVSNELKKIGIEQKHQAINYLRHAVSSQFHILNPNATPEERLNFAETMAHSETMSKMYIQKISGE